MGQIVEQRPEGSVTGWVFLLIGIVSAAIVFFVIYTQAGSDHFFYVASTVNGITTLEYNPFFVIAMLAFGTLFAIAFIVIGIIMIRKKINRYQWTGDIEISIEPGERGYRISGRRTASSSAMPRVSIIIGLLLLAIGGSLLAWDRISLQSLVKVQATVTRLHSASSRSSGGRIYYADIQYRLKGHDYQSRITVTSFFRSKQVTVYCNPQRPTQCRLDLEYLPWYIVLFPCGLIFTFGGLILKTAINSPTRSDSRDKTFNRQS